MRHCRRERKIRIRQNPKSPGDKQCRNTKRVITNFEFFGILPFRLFTPPCNTARLVRFLSLKLCCMRLCSQLGKVQGDCCSSIFFSPTLKRAPITQTTVGLSQEWRGLNNFFKYNAYNTPCAQHASAFPPIPGRETHDGVSVRQQQPGSAVFSCILTGEPVGPESSLSRPSSRACRS